MSDASWWSLWELYGASRGSMVDYLREVRPPGLDPALALVTFGSSGLWPHVVGLWTIADGGLPSVPLAVGSETGLDETRFKWGHSRLLRTVKGSLVPGRQMYLVEHLRLRDAEAMASLVGPDLVLAEAFAPFQGVAFWGADTFAEHVERERSGWGTHGPEVEHRHASWGAVPPERTTGVALWASDPDPV